MNYQTVRLVFTVASGSFVSSFGLSPKVETAAVSSFGLTQKWKLRTRFQFWAVSTFGPAHIFTLVRNKKLRYDLSECDVKSCSLSYFKYRSNCTFQHILINSE